MGDCACCCGPFAVVIILCHNFLYFSGLTLGNFFHNDINLSICGLYSSKVYKE